MTYKVVPITKENVIKNDEFTYTRKETRYYIVSKETGEILDDAQGYGYKTIQKAHAAWAYKNKSEKQKKAEKLRSTEIKKWLSLNSEFSESLKREAFYALKDGEDLTSKTVEKLLKYHDLTPDFKPSEILKVFLKYL